jgi:putative toxin-antitoxin system antitoxin component (TIGR02293 family)
MKRGEPLKIGPRSLSKERESERLTRIISLAAAVWGNEQQAHAFFNRPHPLLDGESPQNIARTKLGARRIERLLYDIEHGLPL